MIGFLTLVIALNLGAEGDTVEVMRAVLDSNFWLATHVVVITIGYSATFLAGALAAVGLVRGLNNAGQRLWRNVLCAPLQLRRHDPWRHMGRSIVGTLLGLGSKGKWRVAHRAVERRAPPPSLGPAGQRPRLCWRAWFSET